MSRVAVNTVQGIGDIFWVYQKLAPYFDQIDLNILCVDLGTIQKRAEAFCHMLPKVSAVTYQKVPSAAYHRIAHGRFPLADALRGAPGPVDYAVNAPLEQGVNLFDIDPGASIEQFVDLGLAATVVPDDYLCVYVSGTGNPATTWRPHRWALAAERLARRLDTARVVMVGAAWDRAMQDSIADGLRGLAVESCVGAALGESIDVIRRSRFFLGYQSGLNVIAENYDVPQMMIYFAKLRPMLYAWCKPESVRTRFHAATFADDVNAIIDGLPLQIKGTVS